MEYAFQLRDEADWYDTVREIDAIVSQLEAEWRTDWVRIDAELYRPISSTSWQEQTRGAEITLSWQWEWDWLHVDCSVGDELERPVLKLLLERLKPVSRQDVQDAAERGGPERATALHKLSEAYATATFDERTARILTAALDSSDLSVREQAASGMNKLAWAEFAPALEAALAIEIDAVQRDKLAEALRACR
jgi:hypothetical protein